MKEDESNEPMRDLQIAMNSDFPAFMSIHDDFSIYGKPGGKQVFRVVSLESPEQGVYHAGVIWPNPKWGIKAIAENLKECLTNLREGVDVLSGHKDEEEFFSIHDSTFSGTVFLYTNSFAKSNFTKEETQQIFEGFGYRLRIRDDDYREARIPDDGWDVFISHDSEDSEFASNLYRELFLRDVNCWIDKSALELGDSLTQRIDEGLARSDYAVIVISEYFIENVGWASDEWEALRVRAASEEEKVILPIWYNVSVEDVQRFSHWLADKQAIRADSIEDAEMVAAEVKRTIRA